VGEAAPEIAISRPNVLFVAYDDLVWLDTPSGSHAHIADTPGFDALGAESLLMRNAIVQQPICTASRGSILTGRRPDTARLFNYKDSLYVNGGSCTNCLTIPELFRAEGYRTTGMGKIFHSWFRRDGGHPRAWDVAKPYCKEHSEQAFQAVDVGTQTDGSDKVATPCDLVILNYVRESLVESAKGGQPWFIGAGFTMSHLPWLAPKEFYALQKSVLEPENFGQCSRDAPLMGRVGSNELDNYWVPFEGLESAPSLDDLKDSPCGTKIDRVLARKLITAYRASVSFADYTVGVIVQDLQTLGLWDSTIIMLWSDHGYKVC
jgi:iduronate 2-sulfatase